MWSRRRIPLLLAALATLVGGGCRDDMRNQPKHRPLDASEFFADGRSSRPLVAGTVARGHLNDDEHLYAGRLGEEFVDAFPFPVTRGVMERGRERYGIYCAPCHDAVGTGRGIIVRRGLRRPPSFHIERLKSAPAGYFFDVITHGFGAMKSYAGVTRPDDRWAIVAYLRALQLSQNATIEDVPAAERARLGVDSES
jgi:hypothetical protein